MHRLICTAIALLAALPGLAQEVSILDLNTDGVISDPYVYLEAEQPTLDGRLFFRAGSDDGEELWVTDGTGAGTFMEELSPGAGGSTPDGFTAVGNRLFFTAIHPGTGRELWTTLGPNQATIFADLEPGPGDSSPLALTALDDLLFFFAGPYGMRGLYTADSLSFAVTEVAHGVVDVNFTTEMVEDRSRVYFKGTAQPGGVEEIWASDGTTGGTEQATALACPGWGELLGVGSSVFVICDFGSSTELFRLDPTPAFGVSLVHRFGDQTVKKLTPAGGILYMAVGTKEIWAYDSGAGTVSQITNFGNIAAPEDLIRYQGDLVFTASAGAGRELYWTDGVTVTEIDIRPGGLGSEPDELRVHDGMVYFTADDGVHGRELWTSDGTVAGTEMVMDFQPGPVESTILLGPSTEFGLAFNLAHHGLWITDGTEGGTVQVPLPDSLATSPTNLHFDHEGDRLFFVGDRGPDGGGKEPFATDGTLAGTVPLGDIEPGPSGSIPVFLATLPNGRTLFSATIGGIGRQLWSSQGLAFDARLTRVINPTGLPFTPSGVTYNGSFYFRADDGINGSELWRSDGTAAGTELLLDLNPSGDSNPYSLAVFGDDLYFGAEDAVGGGLWRTDGTAAGTALVAITSPPGYESPDALTVWGDHLYFSADDGVNGTELWRSDGTEAGTELFADIKPGPFSSSPSDFLAASGLLYFTADDGTTGRELWRTDGTQAGTVLIADLDPTGSSNPKPIAALGGGLVFEGGVDGYRLYVTDGSPGSVTLLLSPYSFSYSSNKRAVWKGHLYFPAANEGPGLANLWRTDGTVAGTENLLLEPVARGSDPRWLAPGPDRLYLSAYDAVAKREIHILEYPLFVDGFESGSTSAWSSVTP